MREQRETGERERETNKQTDKTKNVQCVGEREGGAERGTEMRQMERTEKNRDIDQPKINHFHPFAFFHSPFVSGQSRFLIFVLSFSFAETNTTYIPKRSHVVRFGLIPKLTKCYQQRQ